MMGIGSPDPAPSRLRYRLERLWLSPAFRRAARIGILLAAVLLPLAFVAQNRDFRERAVAGVAVAAAALTDLAQTPEFRVDTLDVVGASPEVRAAIRDVTDGELPRNSLSLDIEQIRQVILRVPAIESATLFLKPGGILEIRVSERRPAAVWRHEFGLALVDGDGRRIGSLESRSERENLPLIIGEGAPEAIGEAMELFKVAEPIFGRIRGLRRVGERRWDLVLDRDQTIKLPESRATDVLKRITGLHLEHRLLDRFVTVVDFRLPGRPVLRVEHDKFRAGDDLGDDADRHAGRTVPAGGT